MVARTLNPEATMKQMVIANFDVPGMSAATYDLVIADLQRAGAGAPAGRRYHAAAPKDGGWWVTDVWDSAEDLDRFAKVLMPILVKNGVTPPRPAVLPLHHEIPAR
jgi:hypothetical protein